MKKKQYLWLIAALVIFAATGWLGVRSALSARERAVSLAEQTASMLSAAVTGPETVYGFPEEPFVAKLKVEGAIAADSGVSLAGGGSYNHQALLNELDALIDCENNVGLLLYVDSPGGEMGAADELYLKLMDYKATGRPIRCYFASTACSGGYYVAMAADEIWANRNCTCVNIGVYISTYNMSGLFEKLGVEQIAFKSSENKGIGMAGLPWTEEQKAIYQSMVDEYYELFVDIVAQGRNMTPDQVKQRDDGREMTAKQALEAGFVDGICRYEEYESRVLQELGTELLYEPAAAEAPLSDLLRYFGSVMPQSDTQALMRFADSHSGMKVMAYAGN